MYINVLEKVIVNTNGIRQISKVDDDEIKIVYEDGNATCYFCEDKEKQGEIFDCIWRLLG